MLSLKGASLMHSRFSRWSRRVSPALAILAVYLTAPLAKAQPLGAAVVNELSGSWRFTLLAPAVSPHFQLQALATLTGDGTFIGAAAGDGASQPQLGFTETAAHGVWRRTSPNNFKVTFWTIDWKQPDGNTFVGFFVVNMTLTLDPRTGDISGSWSGRNTDPNLNTYATIVGTLTAKQILVE
jgi:hypothetical protein